MCLVAQKLVGLFIYLFSLPSTSLFGSFTLSLLGDTVLDWKRYFWGCWTCSSFWIVLRDVSPEKELQRSSFHSLSVLSLSHKCLLSPTGKAFDITYVRLKFHTSRPESFAIYKRTQEDGPWVPYQYYSGSCESTYHKINRGFIRTGEDEQQALCTDEFSDISPLTGGNVAFSTLEGRPSAYNFDNSPVLQVYEQDYVGQVV